MGLIADILKEIPSAARYKSELEAIEKENISLKAQIAVFRSENENLRDEIQRRDNVIQEKESHNTSLDDTKHNLLAYLATGSKSGEEITSEVGLSTQALYFHIEDPSVCKLIESESIGLGITMYSLTPEGRKYCNCHSLL